MAARICPLGLQGGSNIGQKLVKNWPKVGQNGPNIEFWQSRPINHKLHLRIELGTPKNIGFATKHAFLGLDLPELGLGSQIAPLAPLWRFWRFKWRQIGVRWYCILGQTSGGMYEWFLKKFEKLDFLLWKNGLYPVPSVRPWVHFGLLPAHVTQMEKVPLKPSTLAKIEILSIFKIEPLIRYEVFCFVLT